MNDEADDIIKAFKQNLPLNEQFSRLDFKLDLIRLIKRNDPASTAEVIMDILDGYDARFANLYEMLDKLAGILETIQLMVRDQHAIQKLVASTIDKHDVRLEIVESDVSILNEVSS